jgi:hypothetical protein
LDSTQVKPAAHEPNPPSPPQHAQAAEPSGFKDDTPAAAQTTPVHTDTPENRAGHLNPSSPEDSNTTPGTTSDK